MQTNTINALTNTINAPVNKIKIPIRNTQESKYSVNRVAMIGNHTPRQCGIGTFTADLREAIATRFPHTDCFTVAMNDTPQGYDYPACVRWEIEASRLASYQNAVNFLSTSNTDVICLQHEYGIFGGDCGGYILSLLEKIKIPIVTTLHTILRKPNAAQYAVMSRLTCLSDRIIVMSQRGSEFLQEVHSVDSRKIEVIHHGIPAMPILNGLDAVQDQAIYKAKFNLAGKFVLFTFGLLSPDKGIENVIKAMPAILKRFPDVVYVVLGATHPHVRQQHGEAYRESLEALADQLGVRSSIHFHNRFASLEELTQFLRAADVYITPYLNPEQITSGTLAYAVGAGKAVISTPYHYAEELLADDRGILVPWRDPEAIATAVTGLLDEPETRLGFQNRAANYGLEMAWPAVAERYMQTFLSAVTSSHIRQSNRFAMSRL
jgi:glycosyltransferase involved in cell wall biosynthesis